MTTIDDQNTDIYEALLPEGPACQPKRLIVKETTREEKIRNGEFEINLTEWNDSSLDTGAAEWASPGVAKLTAGTPDTSEKVTNGNFTSDLSGWTDNSVPDASVSWVSGHAELTGGTYDGSEKISNGTFDTDLSGWSTSTTGDAYVNWVSGVARLGAGASGGIATLYQSFSSVSGQEYRIDIETVDAISNLLLRVGTAPSTSEYLYQFIPTVNTYSFTFTPTVTTTYVTISVSAVSQYGEIDNVSVKDVFPASAILDQQVSISPGIEYDFSADVIAGSYTGTNANIYVGTTQGENDLLTFNCTAIQSYTGSFGTPQNFVWVRLHCSEDGSDLKIDDVTITYDGSEGAPARLLQSFDTLSGDTYSVSVDVTAKSEAGAPADANIIVGTSLHGSDLLDIPVTGIGTFADTFVGASPVWLEINNGTAGEYVSFDNISVLAPEETTETIDGGLWQTLAAMQANDDPVIEDLELLAYIRDPWKTPALADLEREYGLTENINLSEAERRELLAAWVYDGDANGSIDYLQNQLIKAGFVGDGPEIVTNGKFISDISGWTTAVTGTGSVAWSAGTMAIGASGVGTARAEQSISTIVGEQYTVRTEIATGTTDTLQLQVSADSGASEILDEDISTAGSYVHKFTATTPDTFIAFYFDGDTTTANIEAVSVKQYKVLLQVHSNDPAVDPDPFFDDPDQAYFGDTDIECGEADAECSNFASGEMVVNGNQYFYEIEYLAFFGDTDQECGEEAAMCGDFSGVSKTLIEYPTDPPEDSWPFVFFVGGDATRDGDGYLTDIEFAEIPSEKLTYAKMLITKIKPLHTWCGFLVRGGGS